MEKNVSYLQRFKMMPRDAKILLLLLCWIKKLSQVFIFTVYSDLFDFLEWEENEMAEKNNEIQPQLSTCELSKKRKS